MNIHVNELVSINYMFFGGGRHLTVRVGTRVRRACEWLFMPTGQEFKLAHFLKFNAQSLCGRGILKFQIYCSIIPMKARIAFFNSVMLWWNPDFTIVNLTIFVI